jgi:hypothetical protein
MPKGDGLKTHGMYLSKEYIAWQNMKRRCYYKNYNSYKNYGARGITVCERWINSFQNFFADVGPMPTKKHSLDRVDNNGNYDPKNCRWTSRSVQSHNKRTTKKSTLPVGVALNRDGSKKPYRSYISKDGKRKSLGSFYSIDEAHDAYKKASKELYG